MKREKVSNVPHLSTGWWLSQAQPDALYKKSIMCSEPAAPEMPPPFWRLENQISRTEILT